MSRYRIGLVLGALLCLCSPARSQPNALLLSGGSNYYYDFIDAPSYGLLPVYVLVSSWWGLQSVEFTAPLPDCDGLIYLGQSAAFPQTSGSAETGVSIGFGGCRSQLFHVLTLNYFVTTVDSCCPLDVVAHPNSPAGDIQGVDCQSNTVPVDGMMNSIRPSGMSGCGHPTVPSNPYPPNSAVQVPLTPTLDWDSKPTAGTGLGIFFCNVYVGTTPDPPCVAADVLPPQQGGPLIPNTTYYWKVVSTVTDYGSTTGPLWTFTTTEGVSVEMTTWGAIKAMYTAEQ